MGIEWTNENVRKYEKLAYKIASSYYSHVGFVTSWSKEDINQIALIGLLKAMESFEEGRGSQFPNYACMVMANEVNMELRKVRVRDKVIPRVYLDEQRSTTQDGVEDGNDLHNVFAKTEDTYHNRDFKAELLDMCINDRERDVIGLMIRGYTQAQVRDTLGLHKSQVQRCVSRVAKRCIEWGRFAPMETDAPRDMAKYYTVDEAAAMMGITRHHLYNIFLTPLILDTKKANGRVSLSEHEVARGIKLLAERRAAALAKKNEPKSGTLTYENKKRYERRKAKAATANKKPEAKKNGRKRKSTKV